MNPIAFSYDWGMVTDISRRNQARICSQLEIEHIFRAANIPIKRRNMRKNIEAWLRRPHLGMVPLFMAGDKSFFSIARQLRQSMKIPLVIHCGGNDLERTDFKAGFAGLKEGDHWCLCAPRWKEAFEDGMAPFIDLEATEESSLKIIDMETLKKFSHNT